jgi:hypothetical protein
MRDDLIQNLTSFVDSLNPKQKEVVEKRYGLLGNDPMTLEAIGEDNGVTRERIRQIEDGALKALRKNVDSLKDTVDELKYHLDVLGGIRREKKLLEELSHSMTDDPIKLEKNEKVASKLQNHIWFLLDLAPQFNYLLEKKNNHSGWYREDSNLKKFDSITKFVKKELNKNGKPLELDQYQELIRKVMKEFNLKNENVLLSYLDVSKEFDFNPFGEFGLTQWQMIHPAGVNTKAYLILKKQNQPLHFEEIANLINKVGFEDNREAHANTVHNELIKDSQFVLVGRGLYALKEWGYEPGTVKDVLVKILKKEGPKTYRDLVESMKKHRIVKDTTILINLQDKKLFKKIADGRYALVR